MAKDGDIIDVMLGWIFNMLVKLVFVLIGGIFSLIGSGFKALFGKSENANNQQ